MPLQTAAETRQVAVNVTVTAVFPQERLEGELVRLIRVGLLTRTRTVRPERSWLQLTEFDALPEPADAANEMFNGSDDHDAFALVA